MNKTSYSLLAVSWLSSAWVWATRMVVPTIMPALGSNLKFTAGQEDTLIGVFSLSTGVAFYVFGRIADRIGRKKIIILGFIASVALTSVLALLSHYLMLLALAVGSGFFLGAYTPSSTATLSDYYPEARRGFVLAVHETGTVTGQFAGSVLVAIGIAYLTWRELVGWWALFGFVPLILYWIVAPSRATQIEKKVVHTASSWSRGQNLFVLLTYVGVLSGVTGFVSILPVYLVNSLGVSLAISAGLIGSSRIPAPIGQLVSGRLSDKYGRKPALIIITSAIAVTTTMMAYSPFNLIFIVALFLQFFFGASFFPVLLAAMSDSTTLDERSSRIGLVMSGGNVIGAGLVPIIVGEISARFGYSWAFVPPVILTMLSVISASFLNFE